MADRSENPQDQARLDRLAARLEGTVNELTAMEREGRALSAETKADAAKARSDRQAAAKEARVRQARVGPGGAAVQEQRPEQVRNVTREIEGRAAAETRLAEAVRQRTNAMERAQARDYKRGFALPRDVGLAEYESASARQLATLANFLSQRDSLLRRPPPQLPPGGPPQLPAGQARTPLQLTQFAESARRAGLTPIGSQGQRRLFTAQPGPAGPGLPGGLQGGGAYKGAKPGDLDRALKMTESLSQAEQDLLQRAESANASERKLAGTFGEQARAMGLADNAYTRHGYLTSEFITAAAKGQVTFRELGVQVGGTIAKFAGWTAAASAVYGALAAVSALGRGALESASGVGLLNRVTTKELPGGSDALQKRFRDLSRKFNLPINDVVQASYGSAKAFSGDLPNALKATEQALFAVKVGELSAADSTLYLNAIVKGFRLTADELPATFDAINQAQNRFGGSTGDLIAGVAKAGGIFRLAGGDYRSLIALLTTGSRLTGVSAKEVATAISRSASRVLTPQGQEALSAQGLDPNQGYLAILSQASEKAQGAGASEVNTLARALVPQGGQYARILAPILQNRQLYDQVLAAISPENAKGSAENELKKALAQPNEELKKIITNLEALGGALGTAGGLNLLVGLVKLLNLTLGTTVDLIDRFEELTRIIPQPFRGAVAPILELLALLKLVRRFDVGSHLPERRGSGRAYQTFRQGLQRDPQAALDSRILLGSRDEKRYLEEARRRAAQRATDLALHAEEAEISRNAALSRYHGPGGRTNANRDALVAREAELEQSERAALAAKREQVSIANRIAGVESQLTRYDAAKERGLSTQLAAKEAGFLYAPGTAARPHPSQPVALGRDATTAEKAAYLGGGKPVPQTSAAATKGAQYLTGEAQKVAAEQSKLAAAMASMGIAGGAVGRAATATGRAVKTGFAGLRAAGAGIKGLIASLSLLDLALVGLIGIPLLTEAAKKIRDNNAKAAERVRDIAGGAKGIRESLRHTNDHGGIFSQVGQQFSDIVHDPISTLSAGNIGGPQPSKQRYDNAQQLRDQYGKIADALEKSQPKGRLLDIGQIRKRLADKLTKTRDTAGRIALYDKAINEANNDYIAKQRERFGIEPSRGDYHNQAGLLADLAARRKAQLQKRAEETGSAGHLDLEGLGEYQQGTEARIGFQGLTKSNIGRLRSTTNRVIALAKYARDDKSIEQVAALIQGQHEAAQKIVDEYVAAHPGLSEGVARRRGLRIARSALNLTGLKARAKAVGQEADALDKSIKAQQRALAQVATETRTIGARRDPTGTTPQLNPAGALARLKADRRKLGIARRLMRVLENAIRGLFQGLGGAQQELQDAQAHYDAETQYLAARAGGGLAGDRVTLRRGQGGPYAKLKRGSTDWFTHQADQISTQNSITEQQRAAAQEAAQRQQEAADKARQAAEEARQNAKDLINAQADYAASKTSDPVKQARIAFQAAQRLAKYASGRAEQLESKADVNNRRRDYKNAVVQSKYDDIEFHASIGKLTKDAEISQLSALLRRIKGNKELRRQIRQRIYDLKNDANNDSALDINVGDLRFPTVYDVRRLRHQGLAAATTLQQTNSYHFSVRNDSDVERLGGELDSIHGSGVRAAMRSAGLR